jgi:hypothetical protein
MDQGGADTRLGSTDCERIRPGLIAQPVNTATSLAFVAAAGVTALRSRRRGAPYGVQEAAYSALLALVGAGSVAFHGPQPRGAKVLHDAPIAALLALAVATPVVRRFRGRAVLPGWSPRRGAMLAGVTLAAVAAFAGGRTSAPTCCPDCALQLHGVWHVLAAAGFTLVDGVLYDPSTEGLA